MAIHEVRLVDGSLRQVEARGFSEALRTLAAASGGALRGIDLSGRDLSGADLSGMTFDGCSLKGADLTKARLVGCRFVGTVDAAVLCKADLMGADFRGARLKGVDLTGALLDMADFRGAVLEDCKLGKAVWRAEDLDPAQTAALDAGVSVRAGRKYEVAGSLPTAADPFEGAAVVRCSGLDRDALPSTHATLRRAARAGGALGFAGGMLSSKPAKLVALGGGAAALGSIQAAARGPIGEVLRSPIPGVGEDFLTFLKSSSAAVSGLVDTAMNSFVPGTVEHAATIERIGTLGVGHAAAFAMVGAATVGVMAGSTLVDRMKIGDKVTEFVKARAKVLMEAAGLDGDALRYVSHRARLLFSQDRKALGGFRDLMSSADRAMGHRMLTEGGGYFVVCDRDEFSAALKAMREHARHAHSDPDARPTTFWFASRGDDHRIPAAITFVPGPGGASVLATWADEDGAFLRARLHDGWGRPVEEVDFEGERRETFGPRDGAHDLFADVEGWLEGVRRTRLPAEVAAAFDYDPQTHRLDRANDGVWVLRERATGLPDDGFGSVAVWGERPDGSRLALSYRSGTLLADRSPADPGDAPAAGAGGMNP